MKAEDLEQSRMAKRELHAALKARKEALEATLKKKMEELKVACTAEAVSLSCCQSQSDSWRH